LTRQAIISLGIDIKMVLSLTSLIILIIAALLTSTISGMTGMAGGTILLAIIASIVDTAFIVPLHGTVQLFSSGTRLFLFFKHIKWKIIFFFFIGILPGALIGIYVFKLLDKNIIKLLMGIFILVVTYLPGSKKESKSSFAIFLPIGFLSGLIGIFFGAIGPFIAPFFVRKDVLKEELVATKATCQSIAHVIKIPLFGFIGANILVYWNTILFLCLAVIVGTIIGKNMLNKMSDVTFKKIFKIILTIIALRLIILQTINLL
jgi:uncharacterized membrane protein YfcA